MHLDIVDSSNIINGDETVTRLVQFVEGLSNHTLSCIRHRGLRMESGKVSENESELNLIVFPITLTLCPNNAVYKQMWVTQHYYSR